MNDLVSKLIISVNNNLKDSHYSEIFCGTVRANGTDYGKFRKQFSE